MNKQQSRIIPLERIKPRNREMLDSIQRRHERSMSPRAYDVLLEAQRYWLAMSDFRLRRERYKRYTYGDQWRDVIEVEGKRMTEEEYIRSQGNIPLKNNLIRRLVKQVIGVYRSQTKEPTCTARDRDEQGVGETMSTVLQYNMQLNRASDLYARSMEEFLISGLIVHKKTYGWRNEKMDCWTDYISPNNIFIDNTMTDPRGWDLSCIGQIHDISFNELLSRFAQSPSESQRLIEAYRHLASDRGFITGSMSRFGFDREEANMSFFAPSNRSLCRVIEVWRKETKGRFRCHDLLNGDFFKIDAEDYEGLVATENEKRLVEGAMAGLTDEEISLIETEWFVDSYWYYYFLTPYGEILDEGETPYEHKSHPYVFKAYPFVDGEIHSFVGDVIDQQRYVNRLITLHDWIIRASAKGLLLVPEDAIPDNMSIQDFADEWSRFNGVMLYKPKPGQPMPTQISSNSTNIGTGELLSLQMKIFEDASGIHGALQGKPGHSQMSASLYAQQAQNATTSLVDILDTFSSFVQDGAYKDVKNIQQYYSKKRVLNIAGKKASQITYDPQKIRDVEFDLSIVESNSSPTYRQIANDFLMQIWQAQQISLEQLLEHGDFPFADELLQSIKAQQAQAMQAEAQQEPTETTTPTTV